MLQVAWKAFMLHAGASRDLCVAQKGMRVREESVHTCSLQDASNVSPFRRFDAGTMDVNRYTPRYLL